MTRRLAGCLLLAAAELSAAQAPGPARGEAISVTYRSEKAVYVSAGRAAGLAAGDRLAVLAGQETLAELEVAFVAEHSASCRVVRETRPVKPGDRVVRLGPPRPAAASSPPPAASGAAAPAASAPAAPAAALPSNGYGARPARYTGGVSLGWSTFRDGSDAGRHVEERQARYDLSVRGVGGQALEARARGSLRQALRDNLRGVVLRGRERRDRLYELSLSWAPPEGRFSAAAGRLGASPFASFGYLDGVLGEFRPTASLQAGGFVGRTPDADGSGVGGGAKYGAFGRLAPRTGALPYELVVAGVREDASGDVSREYLAQEAQGRLGGFWLRQRVEVDLNRGWRRERAGRATQLSEARLAASWRSSGASAFTVSYERRRGFWSAFTRPIPGELFDDRVHQTVRADLDFFRRGGMGAWLGGSARTREGTGRRAYAFHGGLRWPQVLAMAVAAEGSAYQTVSTRGLVASARAHRGLGGGHRLSASYTFDHYEVFGVQGRRTSQRIRLSGYGQPARRAFLRADLEHALGDDLQGTRALVEAGYRF